MLDMCRNTSSQPHTVVYELELLGCAHGAEWPITSQ